MAIRWDEFPHGQIRLTIYTRLGHNAVGRSADDSKRHILQRRLASLDPEDHRRFIELEARSLVEHLRCTRDVYREFIERQKCHPILEAHWVVLRFAVFPTAVASLREKMIEYAKLTQIPGRDLSLLFGILTRTCYQDSGHGIALLRPPDVDDDTAATDEELQSLGGLIDEDSLLWFRDIRDGGSVGRPVGGGPFAADDALAIRRSFALCAGQQMTLPDWLAFRDKWWHLCAPWADGLSSLFGSVQEELLSQWRALPPDSVARELSLREKTSTFEGIVVPVELQLPLRLKRGKECEELAKEVTTIRHKRHRDGLTFDEIRTECSSFKIWGRVKVLSREDADTFLRPATWEPGYANLLLGKLYADTQRSLAPGTINTWRKEYRAYLRWREENPGMAASEFLAELKERKLRYRTSSGTKAGRP